MFTSYHTSMYAILRGDVTVHVITDTENEHECYSKVEAAITKKKFNRNDFGNEVAHKGEMMRVVHYGVMDGD